MSSSPVVRTRPVTQEQARKTRLSPARQRFLELCQELHFGRIYEIQVVQDEPVMEPPPRCIEETNLCKDLHPRREQNLADFALKAQVKNFFAYLDRLQNGVILEVIVKDGLPFQVRRRRK